MSPRVHRKILNETEEEDAASYAIVTTDMSTKKRQHFDKLIRALDADQTKSVKSEFMENATDRIISDIIKGDVKVNTKFSPLEKKERVFKFIAIEIKSHVQVHLRAMIDTSDAGNKKMYEKRMELIDKEIESCALDKEKKLEYEDLLEKIGVTADAAKVGPFAVKSFEKPYQD